VGVPEADALNEAVAPELTVSLVGLVTTFGAMGEAAVTVSVAAVVVAEPAVFVNIASYS
jgi:hypothetical protein